MRDSYPGDIRLYINPEFAGGARMAITMEMDYFGQQGLQFVADKVFKVCDENGTRVETDTFFSIPFDAILEHLVGKLDDLYTWIPGMKGMPPFPPVAMFKAVIYAKLNGNMSDRELERHLLRHDDIAAALGFDDIPTHDTIHYFKRERLTVEL